MYPLLIVRQDSRKTIEQTLFILPFLVWITFISPCDPSKVLCLIFMEKAYNLKKTRELSRGQIRCPHKKRAFKPNLRQTLNQIEPLFFCIDQFEINNGAAIHKRRQRSEKCRLPRSWRAIDDEPIVHRTLILTPPPPHTFRTTSGAPHWRPRPEDTSSSGRICSGWTLGRWRRGCRRG